MVKTNKLIKYAFSIKATGKDLINTTKVTYDPFFKIIKRLVVMKCCYPETANGILHYHGIIMLNKNFYRKRLYLDGFSLKLKEIFDEKGWITYITKDLNKLDKKSIMFEPL